MEFLKQRYFMLGIKGTGMSSLAQLLHFFGSTVSGCDSAQWFSTQQILDDAKIQYFETFDSACLDLASDIFIYSSAYGLDHPVARAALDAKMQCFSYPQFIAELSKHQDSYAVAGTHGKTTTCSVAAYLLKTASKQAFPFYALYGSHELGTRSMPAFGTDCALFEACEYRDHFLLYSLRGVLVTCIDYDHPDYFRSLEHVQHSFESLIDRLNRGGFLIYCADDKQALALGSYALTHRPDLTIIQYGFKASGPFQIRDEGSGYYSLAMNKEFQFKLPVGASALVDDYIGAMVLALSIILDRPDLKLYDFEHALVSDEIVPTLISILAPKLIGFAGCEGRTELLFVQNGVVYLDDYAHHPTEIRTSLEQLRLAYPGHRLLVIFCLHTASRTRALFADFVQELGRSDALIVQKTYCSARNDEDNDDMLAKRLVDEIRRSYDIPIAYRDDDQEVVKLACGWLQERWLCITMGAGNNRSLGARIAQIHRSKQ